VLIEIGMAIESGSIGKKLDPDPDPDFDPNFDPDFDFGAGSIMLQW